ncbi:MAG: 2,3-bisphosphoglycerate-independent phosphoglycerate mutase [Desulfovibrionaceae bacterium]|nr:2,3-bisphosphoglycerate-independent phosphoglycerate mutase [Desulfovibrionaceae bacterium]
MNVTPTLLLILDGWGIAPAGSGNAASLARTPNIDKLFETCPHSRLEASGRAVGLPAGYMGNSEVGHLNIGSGRIVYQDMTRIDVAIEDGSFRDNPVITGLIEKVKAAGGTLHLCGLLSDGGVHSHINHLFALCRMAAEAGVPVLVHCLLDGRDTPPDSGMGYVRQLEEELAKLPDQEIAALYGRFYAMDRDKRWERVSQAFNLLVHGEGPRVSGAEKALQASYDEKVLDEFVKPVWVSEREPGLRDGDGIFFFNFRADRMREIVSALTLDAFDGFDRGALPALAGAASMTSYDAALTIPVAFPDQDIPLVLGEVVAKAGLHQLRLAETEKYAHVTFFFNGGVEQPFEGEDRVLVPSPRSVATYDQAPAMSAREVTDRFVEAWNKGCYDLVVCNLANGDMVGHTGIIPAAIEACETVDECVGRMVEAVRARGGRMILIADHGNCEKMLDEHGKPHTAHTTNPVPCILLDCEKPDRVLKDGKLADVAVTILTLWHMDVPAQMNGTSLAE